MNARRKNCERVMKDQHETLLSAYVRSKKQHCFTAILFAYSLSNRFRMAWRLLDFLIFLSACGVFHIFPEYTRRTYPQKTPLIIRIECIHVSLTLFPFRLFIATYVHAESFIRASCCFVYKQKCCLLFVCLFVCVSANMLMFPHRQTYHAVDVILSYLLVIIAGIQCALNGNASEINESEMIYEGFPDVHHRNAYVKTY